MLKLCVIEYDEKSILSEHGGTTLQAYISLALTDSEQVP